MRLHLQFFLRFGKTPICVTHAERNFGTSAEENWGGGEGMPQPRSQGPVLWGILVPRALLTRGATRGLAKSITGYHKNMVRKQYPVLELANQMPVRNMDLARAPRRTARKKGSGYETWLRLVWSRASQILGGKLKLYYG